MGSICTCCNYEKNSEVSIFVQPSAIDTFINDNSLHSFPLSGSDRDPLPILALPPLSEENSVKSKEGLVFFRNDLEINRYHLPSQRMKYE